ncbi:ABC transporter permease [Dyella nitratireducens]|uniref:ABC transporter permease n=1 Tax=Dyella nitratireducens TaxID=1849580 RepID=A0ABQ1FLH8_9GAMM|nr:FtsX-like permease family protein [Dyella nitratireducens]GGA20043.1 ABC transporter permease [Dyella nitratireducens]GLQ44430.1 ABC transporter permease [Dyella nitratireducens]
MHIAPILSALRRHRLATLLIALEIALACAVLCNACFLIASRVDQMHINSGVDEASLAQIKLDCDDCNDVDLNARVLSALRQIPGVQSVSVINAVPFGEHAGDAGIHLDAANQKPGGVVEFYVGGPGSFQALGLNLIQGALPQADDYRALNDFVPADASVWITHALAAHLWPGEDPLGREFWMDRYHYRVAGVVAHLARPSGGEGGPSTREWSVFVPGIPGKHFADNYLIRAQPESLQRVLRDARAAAIKAAPEAVLDQQQSRTIGELRNGYFQQDVAMTGILVGVIAALLLVTALGIVGLASFWVAQRRKQIGVRRALGATQRDILRYFQTENFLIVSMGVMLGMVLTYGLNIWLMLSYELPRLPVYYLPIGVLALWLLGQLAVLAPALRAAAVPPVVATRTE